MVTLASQTRRKCFISYHHADEDEVQQFIQQFDHDRDVLIARGIGASMSGDIIDSTNTEYIKQQIRAKYLRDTTVTIVLIGQETWKRRFVDWEIACFSSEYLYVLCEWPAGYHPAVCVKLLRQAHA